jgi:hypothetical protein
MRAYRRPRPAGLLATDIGRATGAHAHTARMGVLLTRTALSCWLRVCVHGDGWDGTERMAGAVHRDRGGDSGGVLSNVSLNQKDLITGPGACLCGDRVIVNSELGAQHLLTIP